MGNQHQKNTYKSRNMNQIPKVIPQNIYPTNPQPIQCQYNNYCACAQYNHIENVNNINVNLFIPAPNPFMTQLSFFPQNFTQPVPNFNPTTSFDSFNSNLLIPQTQNPLDLGFPVNPSKVMSFPNSSLPNFNSYPQYPVYYNNPSQQQQQTNQVPMQYNFNQPQQEAKLVNQIKKETNLSYDIQQNLSQEYYRKDNSQVLKRRAVYNFDEFDINLKKPQLFGLVHSNN